MRTIFSFTLAAAFLWTASAAAQDGPGRGRFVFRGPGPGFGPGMDILRVEPLELSDAITDAPFSAETITEVVQQLADGNRIEQRTTGSVARDSRGRIRTAQTLAGFGPLLPGNRPRIVTITDSAARELHRLDEDRKVAWKLRLPPPPPGRDGPGGGRPPLPQGPAVKTEKLEPMQIEGVKAEGTRTVLTFPAGAIGNERAIEVVSERWYAPELGVVVSTKRIDPRFGDVMYRLVNIVRAEPPAQLFEVPADYAVRDQPPFPPPPPPR
jgi:hypothetical protein